MKSSDRDLAMSSSFKSISPESIRLLKCQRLSEDIWGTNYMVRIIKEGDNIDIHHEHYYLDY